MNSDKVADLTLDELKRLIRDIVAQTVLNIFEDTNDGLSFRDYMKDRLKSLSISPLPDEETLPPDDDVADIGIEL